MNLPTCLSVALAAGLLAVVGVSADVAPSLKDAAKGHFLIGVALNETQFTEQNVAEAALVKSQFNATTPENVMKWEDIHPEPGRYNFGPADRYVAFGEKNGMFIIGHTLVWHSQIPKWVFEDSAGHPLDRDTLLARMRDHITTVVGRYKGRVKGWDVVNEVVEDDGTLRQTPWLKIIGRDYIAKAFEYAHAADPKAELYYNDYTIENPRKRAGALALIKELQREGVPITGVGIQEHVDLNWPSTDLVDQTISAFGDLGLKVMITELDVNVLPSQSASHTADVSKNEAPDSGLNPYPASLPDSIQQRLAKRYADLFAVYVRHPGVVSRVTFWGLTDGDSWLNFWPIKGRTNYPLLFDRECQPKPAYSAVLQALSAKREQSTKP